MIGGLSVKSVLRTPIKTILFLLLLGAGIASLCLGIGMRESSDRLLTDANETYTTVAYVEYLGENYPDAGNFDSHMVEELSTYDDTPLSEQPQVLQYNKQIVVGATVNGLTLGTRGTSQFKQTGVLLCKVYYVKDDYFTCMIYDTPLFVGASCQKDGTFFSLFYDQLTEMGVDISTIQKGDFLVVHGEFFEGENRMNCFRLTPCNLKVPEQYTEIAKVPLIKVEGDDFFTSDTYTFLYKMAGTYRVLSNHLRVYVNDYPSEMLPFYLDETRIEDGAFYAPDDQNVCVISRYLAEQTGSQIGDTIRLDLYASTESRGVETSFWYDDGHLAEQDYTVVGIFQNTASLYSSVFIPNSGEDWMPATSIDYTISRVKLINGEADAYQQAIAPYLLGSMRVTVYDQGYAHAREAINSMMSTAQLLTIVCGIVTLSLLILFIWLFFQKQRDAARIMLNLGTGKRKTLRFLILSALLVLLLAGVIGGVAGGLLSNRVVLSAYDSALHAALKDYRFSSLATQGESLENVVLPSVNLRLIALTAALAVAAGGVLAFGFFAVALERFRAVRRKEPKKRKGAINKAQKAAVASGTLGTVQLAATQTTTRKNGWAKFLFPLRIVSRSILRNRGKSVIVPFVALMMTVFLGFFVADLNQYEQQLSDVYANMPVTAYMTGYSGRMIDGLSFTESELSPIVDTGFVAKTYFTQKLNYVLLHDEDLAPSSELDGKPAGTWVLNSESVGTWEAIFPLGTHLTGYGAETFAELVLRQPYLIGTNNIRTATEFYFEGDPAFSFMDGYDESLFAGDASVCLVNHGFMEDNGLALGDEITLLVGADQGELDMLYENVTLTIVGTYPAITGRDNIYCPLSATEHTYIKCGEEAVLDGDDAWSMMWRRYWRQNPDQWGVYSGDTVVKADGHLYRYGPDGMLYSDFLLVQQYQSVSYLLQDTAHLTDFKQALSDYGYTPAGHLGKIRRTIVINETTLVETVDSLQRHISYMTALFAAFEVLSIAIGFVVSYLLTKNRRAEFAMMRSMGAGRVRTYLTFTLEQLLLLLVGLVAGGLLVWLLFGAFTALSWQALLYFAGCYLIGILIAAGIMNRARVLDILSVKE